MPDGGLVKIIDPGHVYDLAALDGDEPQRLVFVKREGEGYPGNVGHHPGTNMQEVLRALIERVIYLDNQVPDIANAQALHDLRSALYAFEVRAARRHDRLDAFLARFNPRNIETYPTCSKCGHIGCDGSCHP